MAAHGEYNAAYEAIGIATDIRRRYDETSACCASRYGTTSVDRRDVIKAEIEAASAEGDLVRRQGELKSARGAAERVDRPTVLAPLAAPTASGCSRWSGLAQVQTLGRSANPRCWRSQGPRAVRRPSQIADRSELLSRRQRRCEVRATTGSGVDWRVHAGGQATAALRREGRRTAGGRRTSRRRSGPKRRRFGCGSTDRSPTHGSASMLCARSSRSTRRANCRLRDHPWTTPGTASRPAPRSFARLFDCGAPASVAVQLDLLKLEVELAIEVCRARAARGRFAMKRSSTLDPDRCRGDLTAGGAGLAVRRFEPSAAGLAVGAVLPAAADMSPARPSPTGPVVYYRDPDGETEYTRWRRRRPLRARNTHPYAAART